MSVVDKVQTLLASIGSSRSVETHECKECGNTFEPRSAQEDAQCMACFSSDTRTVE